MARFGSLGTQYFDDSGNILADGKIHFYESGTTVRKNTFSDINMSIPNQNPVVLYADGRQPNIFFSGVARAVLETKDGVIVETRDPVGETSSMFGEQWIPTRLYSANQVAQGSDGQLYISLINSNIGNNPLTSPGAWSLLYSIEWNAGFTYKEGAVVTYTGGIMYQSLQNDNLNHEPDADDGWWAPIWLAWSAGKEYSAGENVTYSDGVLYTSLTDGNIGNIPPNSPTEWAGTSAAAAASAAAASGYALSAQGHAQDAEDAKEDAEDAQALSEEARDLSGQYANNAIVAAAAAQAAAGLPSLTGNALASLRVKADESGVEWGESSGFANYRNVVDAPFDIDTNPDESRSKNRYVTATFSDVAVDLGDTGTAMTIPITTGGYFKARLTGNVVFTLDSSDAIPGRVYSAVFDLTNDGTANRSIAWTGGGTTVHHPGGAIARTTAANAKDRYFITLVVPVGGGPLIYEVGIAQYDLK